MAHRSRSVSERLKMFRLERDLSFKEMADLLKVSISSVYHLENGHRSPNERTLYRILNALGGENHGKDKLKKH